MDTELARQQMVAQQIRAWDVLDAQVLDVFNQVPRERFVPARFRALAFADTEVPLGHGQFMMTPTVEGRMLQALKLLPIDRVLEIGTGSGFVAACLSRLAQSVVSVELFPEMSEAARAALEDSGIDNVTLLTMDAARELPDEKYDAVAVTASLPMFDTRFFDILKPGGRLFVIVGNAPVMEAQIVVRGDDDGPVVEGLFETNVLPMRHAAAPPAFRF